jgi:hypothetical protein
VGLVGSVICLRDSDKNHIQNGASKESSEDDRSA